MNKPYINDPSATLIVVTQGTKLATVNTNGFLAKRKEDSQTYGILHIAN